MGGINWNEMTNPETLPRVGYIPSLVLPTVFSDALTYAEVQGRIVKSLNMTIEAVNELAGNVSKSVQEIIRNAKVPAYFNLLHNGSVLVDTDNWYLEDPDGLYNALSEGKLCILEVNCTFNNDGYAVPDADNHVKFLLMQVNEAIDGTNFIKTVAFVNIDEYLSTRIAEFTLTKSGSTVTAQTTMLFEVKLVSQDTIDKVNNNCRNKVLIYVGGVAVPGTSGEYIELIANGTIADLSTYFACVDGVAIYASNVCPCIVVDGNNGNVGVLTYGGAINPWVRIYSVGICIFDGVNGDIGDLANTVNSLERRVGDDEATVSSLAGTVGTLRDDVDGLETDVSALDDSVVKFTTQSLTSSQKNIARNNIESVARFNPIMRGLLTFMSTYYNLTMQFDDEAEVKTLVISGEGDKPIVRGIHDPVENDDVATKQYVDSHGGGGGSSSHAVLYVGQDLTENEKRIARENIDAMSVNNPRAIDSLTLSQSSGTAVSASVAASAGQDIVTMLGDNGDVIVRGVANPAQATDVANKRYVDAIKNFYIEVGYDGYYWTTDKTQQEILDAISAKKVMIAVMYSVPWQDLDGAQIVLTACKIANSDAQDVLMGSIPECYSFPNPMNVIIDYTPAGYATWRMAPATYNPNVRKIRYLAEDGCYVEMYTDEDDSLTLIAVDDGEAPYKPIIRGIGEAVQDDDAVSKGLLVSKMPFYVTFEGDTSDSNAVCNRTLTEVLNAITAGRSIVPRWYDRANTTFYYLNVLSVVTGVNQEFVAQCVKHDVTGGSDLVNMIITCGIDTNNPYVHIYTPHL